MPLPVFSGLRRLAVRPRGGLGARVALVAVAVIAGALTSAPAAVAAPQPPSPQATAVVKNPHVISPADGRAAGAKPTRPTSRAAAPGFQAVQLQNRDGRLERFWVGRADGTYVNGGPLYHQWQDAAGRWSGAVSMGGSLFSGIDGGHNADGRLEIFGKAGGNDLVHIYQLAPNGRSGWSGWVSLGGVIAAGHGPELSYFSNPHRIVIDVFGPDGRYHRKYQVAANGPWNNGWA